MPEDYTEDTVRAILNRHDAALMKGEMRYETLSSRTASLETGIATMNGHFSELMATVMKLSFEIAQLTEITKSLKGLDRLTMQIESLRTDFEAQKQEIKENGSCSREFNQRVLIVLITAIVAGVGTGGVWIIQKMQAPTQRSIDDARIV